MTIARAACSIRSGAVSNATAVYSRGNDDSCDPHTVNKDQIAERGARMARRDDREYREYLREEQRSQSGCPAREVVLDHRMRAVGFAAASASPSSSSPRWDRSP